MPTKARDLDAVVETSVRNKLDRLRSQEKFRAFHDGEDLLHELIEINVAHAHVAMNDLVAVRFDALELHGEGGGSNVKPSLDHALVPAANISG